MCLNFYTETEVTEVLNGSGSKGNRRSKLTWFTGVGVGIGEVSTGIT